MDCQSLGMHVFTNTSHLNGMRSEKASSVLEVSSREADRVVSFTNDQHSYYLFVSIYYKVSTEFMHVFAIFNEVIF